jgi:hypothetical protein
MGGKSMSFFKITLLGMCALVVFVGTAFADNTPADSSALAPEAAGTCTAPCVLGPRFTAVNQTLEYSVTGTGFFGAYTVAAEDGCVVGDKYELTVKRKFGKPAVGTTSGSQVAGCTCTYSSVTVNDLQVTAKGFLEPVSVKFKSIALPGGVPAIAYLRFPKGSVTQTVGVDDCL